jgi:hypothetical protein
MANDRRALLPVPTRVGKLVNVSSEVVHTFWEARAAMSWSSVHLPMGGHLNPDRVSIP